MHKGYHFENLVKEKTTKHTVRGTTDRSAPLEQKDMRDDLYMFKLASLFTSLPAQRSKKE